MTSKPKRVRRRLRRGTKRREGVALIVVMTAVAILAILLADMHESTGTAYAVATTQRDQLKAEFLARGSINLTRLLINKEPAIRQTIAPLYQGLVGRAPPQLPIWDFADEVLVPFCDFDASGEQLASAGIEMQLVEGLGGTGGTCSIHAVAENGKINVNLPLLLTGERARTSLAQQVYGHVGGYQLQSPYDVMFSTRDADGQFTTRLDVVSDLIDWWDYDQERSVFDPGASAVTQSGGEDDVYARFRDPYRVKNAPFDSLEEIRLIRGVSDDFWATFVQPDPDDLHTEQFTIYGSGAVNPNNAPPQVLLSRICSFLYDQPLCTDLGEVAKFIQILTTVRGIAPIPWFSRGADFVQFIEGGGGPMDLYPMLRTMLGPQNPLLFRPVTIPADRRAAVEASLVTSARILTIRGEGHVGRATVRIRAVLNTHDRWTPPPPNTGSMPGLGVFHYWRVD